MLVVTGPLKGNQGTLQEINTATFKALVRTLHVCCAVLRGGGYRWVQGCKLIDTIIVPLSLLTTPARSSDVPHCTPPQQQ